MSGVPTLCETLISPVQEDHFESAKATVVDSTHPPLGEWGRPEESPTCLDAWKRCLGAAGDRG